MHTLLSSVHNEIGRHNAQSHNLKELEQEVIQSLELSRELLVFFSNRLTKEANMLLRLDYYSRVIIFDRIVAHMESTI